MTMRLEICLLARQAHWLAISHPIANDTLLVYN